MKNKIYEDWVFNNYEIQDFKTVNEADGSYDDLGKLPNQILSIVRGPSFVPDGYSRNGRFYPKKVWENALKNQDFKTKLDRKLVFGCIGHPTGNYTLDELLESGKVSHIVSKMEIVKNQGICEFLVLDTPAGRILNTILKAGSKPYVSTRAFGGFSNEIKEKNGKEYKVIDENNFSIESVDFVIDPGFLEASPELVTESLKEDFKKLKDDKIKCENGICELQQPKNEEDLNNLKETNKEIKREDKSEILEDLDKYDKDTLKLILNNLIQENKKLLEENSNKIEEKIIKKDVDVEEEVKKRTLFISYLEVLLKLLKYDKQFEKEYSILLEFLNKDDIISENELDLITKTLSSIKEKTLEESILNIINKLEKIKVRFSKKDKNEALSVILYYYDKKDEEFNSKLKNSYSSIKKHESVISILKKSILKLTEERYSEIKKIETLEEKLNQLKSDKEVLKSVIEKMEQTSVKESVLIQEKNNIKKQFEKELSEKLLSIKEKFKKDLNELEEKYKNNELAIKEQFSKELNKKERRINQLSESLFKTIIENLSFLYPRLDKTVIENTFKSLNQDLNETKKHLKQMEKRLPKRYNYDNHMGIIEKKIEKKESVIKKRLENLSY